VLTKSPSRHSAFNASYNVRRPTCSRVVRKWWKAAMS
jgi:hypothetical protein